MGAPSITWDSSFESIPAGSSNASDLDTFGQNGKIATREREEREHVFGLAETQSKHGWHRKGSGRAWFQAAAPTTKVDGTGVGGALDSDDDGRIFVRSSDFLPFVWDGSAFQCMIRSWIRASVQGVMATGTKIMPRIVLPRACKLLKVSAYLETAPTGASFLLDINKNGAAGQSVFDGATRITIAAGANADNRTSFHATYGLFAAEDTLTIDIDQVGSTVAGADLGVTLEIQPV